MFEFLKSKKKDPDKQADGVNVENKVTDKADKKNLFTSLSKGLKRTRANFTQGVVSLLLGKKNIDDELLEEIEACLLTADVGVEVTNEIIAHLTEQVSRKTLSDPKALLSHLKKQLVDLLAPCDQPLVLDTTQKPYVILVVGVNGSGKTTTIGKLAHHFQAMGKSVMLAAGDTFRAAAIEQLKVWGERNKISVVAQKMGSDSASVIYDALSSAKAKKMDVLIADTSGRLHTQEHLMNELKKIKRVMTKLDSAAPHEVMLVLDAGIGQNSLQQAQQFAQAVGVSGITMTKLDGTAKGGVIFAIAHKMQLPIRYMGVGEKISDLQVFNASHFVEAIFRQE